MVVRKYKHKQHVNNTSKAETIEAKHKCLFALLWATKLPFEQVGSAVEEQRKQHWANYFPQSVSVVIWHVNAISKINKKLLKFFTSTMKNITTKSRVTGNQIQSNQVYDIRNM